MAYEGFLGGFTEGIDKAALADYRESAKEKVDLENRTETADHVLATMKLKGHVTTEVVDMPDGEKRIDYQFDPGSWERMIPGEGANIINFALQGNPAIQYVTKLGRKIDGKVKGIVEITPDKPYYDKEKGGKQFAFEMENKRRGAAWLSPNAIEGEKDLILFDSKQLNHTMNAAVQTIVGAGTEGPTIAARRGIANLMLGSKDAMTLKTSGAPYDETMEALDIGETEAKAAFDAQAQRRVELGDEIRNMMDLINSGEDYDPVLARQLVGNIIDTSIEEYGPDHPLNTTEVVGDNVKVEQSRREKRKARQAKRRNYPYKGEYNDPDRLFSRWTASNVESGIKEAENELGIDERTPDQGVTYDFMGSANSPTGSIRKVFEHLELPTKRGEVTKGDWKKAQDYLLAMRGAAPAVDALIPEGAGAEIDKNIKAGTFEPLDEIVVNAVKKKIMTWEETGIPLTFEKMRERAAKDLDNQERKWLAYVIAAEGTNAQDTAKDRFEQVVNALERGDPFYSKAQLEDDIHQDLTRMATQGKEIRAEQRLQKTDITNEIDRLFGPKEKILRRLVPKPDYDWSWKGKVSSDFYDPETEKGYTMSQYMQMLQDVITSGQSASKATQKSKEFENTQAYMITRAIVAHSQWRPSAPGPWLPGTGMPFGGVTARKKGENLFQPWISRNLDQFMDRWINPTTPEYLDDPTKYMRLAGGVFDGTKKGSERVVFVLERGKGQEQETINSTPLYVVLSMFGGDRAKMMDWFDRQGVKAIERGGLTPRQIKRQQKKNKKN